MCKKFLGESGIEVYKTAWKRLSVYSEVKISTLKTKHYQDIIDQMVRAGLSRSSTKKMKHLISQLCKYAMKNDIIDKNYGDFLVLPKIKKND